MSTTPGDATGSPAHTAKLARVAKKRGLGLDELVLRLEHAGSSKGG
jgi:hypothetical protein